MLDQTIQVIGFLAYLFIFSIGVLVLVVAILFVRDVAQTTNAVRRNFPVIGRFRYLFEHLGEFFRQYFFAMDREELPFNRVGSIAPAKGPMAPSPSVRHGTSVRWERRSL